MAIGHTASQLIDIHPRFDNPAIDGYGLRHPAYASQVRSNQANQAVPSSPSYKDYEFEIWDVGDFLNAKNKQSYLIDGLIPSGGHILLYAPTGHLKSFTAIDIACSIASGKQYRDRATTQGEVVYVAAEAATEIGSRIRVWGAWHKLVTNIHFVGTPLQLRIDAEMERLRRFIDSRGGGVKLVVIDTVSRCAIGIDENKPTEVNQFVNAPIEKLIRETGVSVLLVHHQGGTAGPRGCTAWSDPCDVIIKAETVFVVRSHRQEPLVVTLQVEKQRRGEPFAVSFKPVKTRGTLVLAPINASEAASIKTKKANKQEAAESTATRKGRASPKASDLIVAVIQQEGRQQLQGIVKHTGLNQGTVKNRLTQLVNNNVISRDDGWYSLATQ